MNPNKLSRLFPHASNAFKKLNVQDSPEGICTPNKEQFEGDSLVCPTPREAKGRNRFKIVFTVYSVRPADWDAYHIKELQDLLVKSGVIPDDDWTTLKGEVSPEKVGKKDQERTEIEIYELP